MDATKNIEYYWLTQLVDDARKLRLEVFNGEQNFSIENEFDCHDLPSCVSTNHLMIYFKSILIGYVKMVQEDYGLCLSRIIVKKEYRNMKLGQKMIQESIKLAQKMGFKELWISSLKSKIGYYQKFGFHEESDYIQDEHDLVVLMVNRNIIEQKFQLRTEWIQDQMKLIHILYNFDKVVGKITLCKKNDTKWIVEKFTMASDHKNKIFEKILRFNLVRKMKDDQNLQQ